MATVATSVNIHRAAVDRLLYSPAGPVHREVSRVTRRTESGAKRRAPVNTGKLRASIQSDVTVIRGVAVIGRVWTPLDYGLFQHQGTGIYGPRHRVITPRRGRFLVFEATGPFGPLARGARRGTTLVFARSVRGVPPNPFLVDALVDASPWPVIRHRPV